MTPALLCLLMATQLPPVQPAASAQASPGAPLVEFSLTPEVVVRQVRFHQRLTPLLLAGYRSGVLGLVRLGLAIYPAANRDLPIISDIGLTGSFGRSMKTNTLTADGALAFQTSETAWDAGARWRGIFSGQERLALSLSYGSLRNDYTGAQLPNVLLPSGTLQYWRPGAEARFPFGAFALGAGAGVLFPVSRNAIGKAFPRSTSAGVDADLHGSLDLGRTLLRLSLKYTRFFYALHPVPHDPFIAGGALDELFALDLSIILRF